MRRKKKNRIAKARSEKEGRTTYYLFLKNGRK